MMALKLSGWALLWGLCYQLGSTLDLSECGLALGMETKEIKDLQISVSSSFDESSVGPQSSRIRTEVAGGAWCPVTQIAKDSHEWLEIDLLTTRVITAVETQGRYGDGKGLEYPTHYMLDYMRAGQTGWVRFRNRKGKEIFDGNNNPFAAVSRELDPPIIASKIRFVPYSIHPRTVCMRVELHGCDHSEGLMSYSVAQGAVRSDLDLRDKIYDGILTPSGILSGGLGLLSDGKAGGSTFLSNLTGNGPGYEWVGWKNTTVGPFIEMTFRFDTVRNFSSVNFHVNNQYKQEIKAFSMARLWFSNGGKYFSRAPSTFIYPPANFLEASHWVKVKTPGQFGAFVKIQLMFGAKWMLISEIQFESKLVKTNVTIETAGLQQLPEPKIPKVGVFMDELDGLQVAPLAGVPTEYIALIIGVMVASLIVCSIIVIVIMIRQRRQGKLSSTAYGFKLLQQSSQRQSDVQVGSSVHSKSNLKGNMYVLDSGKAKRSETFSQTIPNSLESFHFPPPPAQEYADSSDYAEPQFTSSASTLPLLPARTNQRNPTFTYSSSPKKLSILRPQLHYKLDDDSLHYASSDVTIPSNGLTPDDYCQIDGPSEFPSTSNCEFPRDNLIFRQAIGAGDFGEVFVCDIAYPVIGKVNSNRQMVAVKMLRKSASEAARKEFLRELKILSTLRDPNLVQLLGSCTQDEPWLMVLEYFEAGDLHSYLRKHSNLMSVEVMLHMCSQIASGMKFLESLHFVHRDLAARNCLVGDNYAIKVADLGMTNPAHSESYYKAETAQFALPIRWMAWESISGNRFTPKSDVWAFAVTVWEIFSLCATKPYESLTNEEVIANCLTYSQSHLQTFLLHKPLNCPVELYKLMLDCWQVDEANRPSFKAIHQFLQQRAVSA